MKITALQSIKPLVFSAQEAAESLGVTDASAKVACHRYVKKGLIIRVKRNTYVLGETWKNADDTRIYRIANRIQVPSYISFTTALSAYELTTQVQQGFIESAAVTRTKEVRVKSMHFRYTKLQRKLFFGYVKKDGYFIATPEKALLDALYLMSIKRYRLDVSSIDYSKFNPGLLKSLSMKFSEKTRQLLKQCRR